MNVYEKLFAYIPEKKYLSFVAMFVSAISAISVVLGYYYVYKFLETLIVISNLSLAKTFAIKTTFAFIVGSLFYFLSAYFSHILGFGLETNLRKKGIDGLSNASFRFFDLNSSGAIRKIIDDNAAQTHTAVAHLIPDSSRAFIIPILSIILGFIVSLRVGITLVLVTFIGIIFFKRMMSGNDFMERYQKALELLSSESVEYVRGMQVVKIFGADVSSFKSLHKAINDYSKCAYEYSISCKKDYVPYQWIFFSLMAILLIPVTIFKSIQISPLILTVDLIMTLFLSGVIFNSMQKMMWAGKNIFDASYAVTTLEKMFNDMGKDSLVFGNDTYIPSYDIEFDNVSFGYKEKPVLKNFNLKIKEGKSYALVGTSGSGKSTIAKLLSGFYKVDNGSIKIGGKPIENYTKETITGNISFIFQNTKLFKKSIYENVALARKSAKREEVLKALEIAGCTSILDKFPERENTIIGSKGVYLSGGEKQRIAIARAILKDSKIIIMDEASASIDPDNEYELQMAFKNLMRDKTVIMIAHRLSSIKDVDEILVLENGKVVERGTDEKLMISNGKYRNLQDLYHRANEWRVIS